MEIRTAPKEWIKILKVAYPFLREEKSVADLVLFGSQALSVYMENPLRSKDLDFLSARVGFQQMEELTSRLSQLEKVQSRSTTVLTRMFGPRRMRTRAIELRIGGKPFFLEISDSILDARPTSLLTQHLALAKRWGLEIWLPEREAILAFRLAFRPPEGISRLNATRLNNFIRENKRSIKFNRVASILKDWKIEVWVEKNLVDLYRRNKLRIIGDEMIIPEIEKKLWKPQEM
jgi:hypothetical protein